MLPVVGSALSAAPRFASFGEFASSILGIRTFPLVTHVAWVEKTPIATVFCFSSSQAPMAYRFIDPAPFMLNGAQRVMIPGRPLMKRVVTAPIQERNNDVAIALLHPMPRHHIDFANIREILMAFFNANDIPYLTIQRCPFGQAYVRFSHLHHKDFLIGGGPYNFGNGTISFIPHNRACNNRTAFMTHEVWLMLLGLNLDLWNNALVEKAVSEFGRLLAWEEDENHMSRILVRARVFSLDKFPWFFTFSDGNGPDTDSWSVQCEVLQTHMLGVMPQDEDMPPEDPNDFDPEHFQFFGFGQPGQGPPNLPPADGFGHNDIGGLDVEWDLWNNPQQ